MKTITRSARRTRLNVDSLERRDTPAGSITAAFSSGVLTLTGDVAANHVQIRRRPGRVRRRRDRHRHGRHDDPGPNRVRGSPGHSGQPERRRRHAVCRPQLSLVLGGALSVDLGDGNNSLDLRPTGNLGLGGLTVKATSGADVMHLVGPDGGPSWVAGPVDLSFGEGGSTTTLGHLDILGRLNLIAGEGDDSLTTDDVRIGRPAGPGPVLSGSIECVRREGSHDR